MTYSNQQVQSASEPEHLHAHPGCVSSKVTCDERLAQTDPRHSEPHRTGGGHPWHCWTSSQPSEVPREVICYKHTTRLDSPDNPNEFQ